MVYLLNTLDHSVTFYHAQRPVVEQYATSHPNAAEVIVEVQPPAYAMMALRDATQRVWRNGVKPLLEKLATFPNLELVAEEAKLELFLDFMGVDEALAREQMHAFVREQLRAPQGRHVEKVSIDVDTGEEIPLSADK